jgi:hypothetical protein
VIGKFCIEFKIGNVNWDMIQIDDKLDDEGKLEFTSEEQLYVVLGLKEEDNRENQEKERRTYDVGPSNSANICDDSSAVIPIFQHLPGGGDVWQK